jgi:hypothetical protein
MGRSVHTVFGRKLKGNIMNINGMGWKGVNWIQMAEDRDWWRALVNTAMNLRGTYKFRLFLD